MNQEIGKTTLQLIKRDLSPQRDFDEGEEMTFDRLLSWLITEIRYLLDHDFNALLNALYRIDLKETVVADLLEKGNPELISENLARAILERERKKAETRLKYKDW